MNATWKYGLLLLTVAALVMGAGLVPAGAEEDEDGQLTLDGLAAELVKAKISLAAACDTAAKAAAAAAQAPQGVPFAAEFEVEDGRVLYDVFVLVPGTSPRLFEVEVDAVTGKVIEVEEEGVGEDDDDDDDDDDEEDDEDEGDDDDEDND